ncbi:hypothetical protein Bca4012_024156 [Brassica carinata]
MTDLILDTPRKWQLYDRVKGVALSKDRFQFIFKYEQDLLDILNRGAHTSNQWSIALERWVERPPSDYLQFIEVWVQMRNIPVNHYTKAALTDLAEFAGQVIEVAFDPDKPQTKDYIRAKIKFDVSKPLRRYKTVNVPGGEVVKILYDYERLQKRCYTCQRLTHEQSSCPFFQAAKAAAAAAALKEKRPGSTPKQDREKVIKEDDPLFGVVLESQVGINPLTGRPRIAEEVLEGMRQYLMTAEGAEKLARKDRIKLLEPAPIFTPDLNKNKGIVFDFEKQKDNPKVQNTHGGHKLMASAIRAGTAMSLQPSLLGMESEAAALSESASGSWNPGGSTGYNIGIFDACSSGTKGRKTYQRRRRPGSFVRKARGKETSANAIEGGKLKEDEPAAAGKRKNTKDVETSQYSPRGLLYLF